jgi:hypothetical protein
VRAMADDRDPDIAMHAFDLWVGHTDDPDAKPALLAAAASGKADRRRAAWPVVDRYKLGTPDLRLNALSLDLQQEATCEARKRVVASLRALGDPRAAAALERATTRSMRRQNACLFDDATAAIRALRAAEKKQ